MIIFLWWSENAIIVEYLQYYGAGARSAVSKEQKLHRRHKASGGQANRILAKRLGVKKLPQGYEVDHRDKNPLNNELSNIRLMKRNLNRGKCRLRKC